MIQEICNFDMSHDTEQFMSVQLQRITYYHKMFMHTSDFQSSQIGLHNVHRPVIRLGLCRVHLSEAT